jgi:hypothetical protein
VESSQGAGARSMLLPMDARAVTAEAKAASSATKSASKA